MGWKAGESVSDFVSVKTSCHLLAAFLVGASGDTQPEIR